MPRGGQNRKPRQAKIIQGTFRTDRNPGREPTPPVVLTLPKPPAGMNRWARRLWKNLVQDLVDQQLLTSVDLTTLELTCEAYGQYKEAKEAVFRPLDPNTGRRARLSLAEYMRGRNSQTMPEYTAMTKAFAIYKSYLTEFGLSPASRNRIHLPVRKEAGEDPMERLLRGT